MSVVAMKKIFLCGLNKDRKKILEKLQRRGTVEVVEFGTEDELFTEPDTEASASLFRKNAALADQALEVLLKYAPEKTGLLDSLSGRKEIGVTEYDQRVRGREDILRVARRILELDKEIAEARAEIPRRQDALVALEPWKGFDLPLNFSGTSSTAAFIGSVQGQVSESAFLEMILTEAGGAETVDVSTIAASKEQSSFMVLCSRREEEAVRDALRHLGFAKAPAADRNPAEESAALEKEIQRLEGVIEDKSKRIESQGAKRDELRFAADYYRMRADKYDVLGELGLGENVFVLQGYATAQEAAAVAEDIGRNFNAVVELSDPEEGEAVPVVLRNNPFAAPVESVVESFSPPALGERDPTSLVAIFYYILFGFMLSDAGYGLIMVIATTFVLVKYKDSLEIGTKRFMEMFRYCGIATTIVGFLFGSFFGNAVNVIADTFFGRPDIQLKAIWLDPLNEPMKMLSICFLVGIIHLFVGLGAKLYACIKDGHILDGIFDVVFWYMLVGGAILYLLTMPMLTEMLAIETPLPAPVGTVAAIAAVIGAVGIILTSGRESRNWGKRLLKGLYGVYGISSYLSDILSYSRLLALGLATSVISQVFNTMGSMVAKGRGVIGVIFFILIFVVGHVLNLLINALGAYVHTNRLTFVEFFGKFYEGGGKLLAPFTAQTKYYKVKEEN